MAKLPNIANAILEINPNASFSVTDENINSIVWINDTAPISKNNIEKKLTELQTLYDNAEYQRKRKNNFRLNLSITEQLDKLYHDIENETLDTSGEFFTARKSIKDKFPKE